jgi:hypothetical protein
VRSQRGKRDCRDEGFILEQQLEKQSTASFTAYRPLFNWGEGRIGASCVLLHCTKQWVHLYRSISIIYFTSTSITPATIRPPLPSHFQLPNPVQGTQATQFSYTPPRSQLPNPRQGVEATNEFRVIPASTSLSAVPLNI